MNTSTKQNRRRGFAAITTSAAAALALAAVTTTTAIAEQDGTAGENQASKAAQQGQETPESRAVAQAVRALALADEARELDSATMMIAAAELLARAQPTGASRELDAETESSPLAPDEQVETEEKGESQANQDAVWSDLLDEASEMADGDENLNGVIEDTRTRLQRAARRGGTMGAVGGPQRGVHRIDARSIRTFKQRFVGGELARVGINGDNDTDLDLYIYDQNGNRIGSSTSYGDYEVVTWTPRWTGEFTVRVVNLGYVWNRAVIWTN